MEEKKILSTHSLMLENRQNGRITCTDALAGLSLTRTLPASHASFATVRRLIRRDTFKYLSNLIFCSCKCSVMDVKETVKKEDVESMYKYL